MTWRTVSPCGAPTFRGASSATTKVPAGVRAPQTGVSAPPQKRRESFQPVRYREEIWNMMVSTRLNREVAHALTVRRPTFRGASL